MWSFVVMTASPSKTLTKNHFLSDEPADPDELEPEEPEPEAGGVYQPSPLPVL